MESYFPNWSLLGNEFQCCMLWSSETCHVCGQRIADGQITIYLFPDFRKLPELFLQMFGIRYHNAEYVVVCLWS